MTSTAWDETADNDEETAEAETGGDAGTPAWNAQAIIDWVDTVLFPVYVRPLKQGQFRWCETWWKHAEAWARFEACRRAWAQLAAEAGIGFSVWHRDHLDPMLAVLLSESGPFSNCTHSASSLTTTAKHAEAGSYPRQTPTTHQGSDHHQAGPDEEFEK